LGAQRLFISHASEDEAAVNRIVSYLEAHGAACWIASRDIPPQSIYADAIAEGMEECTACVVILSAASNQSKAVKRELELASHYDKPFIPIRIDATEPARGFDYYLRNTQWIDYGRDGERALDRIGGRSAPSTPPPRLDQAASATPPRASTEEKGKRFNLAWIAVGAAALVALATWAVTSNMRPAPDTESAGTTPAETVAPPAVNTASASPPIETAQIKEPDPAATALAARIAQLPNDRWVGRVRTEPIIAGQSMAGVRFGQSRSDVVRMLGQPNGAGEYRKSEAFRLIVTYDEAGMVSEFRLIDADRRLAGLMTGAQGAGIGSTRADIEAALGSENLDQGSCISYDVRGLSFGLNDSGEAVIINVFDGGPGAGCDY